MDRVVKPSYELGILDRLLVGCFHLINKFIAWHKLPGLVGAINLDALRIELRQYNLHDGYSSAAAQGNQSTDLMDKRFETARNSDGKFNSIELPLMGCAGMRLGRNFPRQLTPKPTEDELWNPNPRMLSERFMKRKEFIPATSLNLLAAAWIQFQTHDWFFHENVGVCCDNPTMSNMLLTTCRATTPSTSRYREGTNGRNSMAKCNSHKRGLMTFSIQSTGSVPATRTRTRLGGIRPKSTALRRKSLKRCEPGIKTAICISPTKEELPSSRATRMEIHSQASTATGG